MTDASPEVSDAELKSQMRTTLLYRYNNEDVISDLRLFRPLENDYQPRNEDLERLKRGLADPALLPKQALDDASIVGNGEIPAPFESVESFTTLDLNERLAERLDERAKAGLEARKPAHLRQFKFKPTHLPKKYVSPHGGLVDLLAPEPGQSRSVLFVHHSYYHFYYLAQALRRRGWNAWSVSIESPDSANQAYYHGEDLNLYQSDPVTQRGVLYELFDAIRLHYGMLHTHSDAFLALFKENRSYNNYRNGVPYDFMELKALGVKLGLSMSGCVTGQRASVFNQISGGVCNTCTWQGDRGVCSEAAQFLSGSRIEALMDLYALEGDWPADFSRLNADRCFYDPLTYCIHDGLWHPDLTIPKRIELFKREPGEVLVLHSVGGIEDRQSGTRNIKGTPAVVDAVERLKTDGYNVRLIFKTGVPSRDMRFYQIQADIVVDQLNYGRYGATARECMALGLPTITRLHPGQPYKLSPSPSLQECPLIDASEATVYDAIKDLLDNPEKRERIGRASREYAVKWHSADACAERFEKVYDRVLAGEDRLDVPSVYQSDTPGTASAT